MLTAKKIRKHGLSPIEQLAYCLGDKEYKDNINKTPEENINIFCSNNGIVTAKGDVYSPLWYKNMINYKLMKKVDGKSYYLLIPSFLGRYKYYEPVLGKFVMVTKKQSRFFEYSQYPIFKPLPTKKLRIRDLLRFAARSWTLLDYLMIVLLTALVTFISYGLPKLNSMLFSNAIPEGNIAYAFGVALSIIAFNFGMLLFTAFRSISVARLSTKTDGALRTAMMMRLITLPNRTFTDFSAGDISKRLDYLEDTARSLVSSIFVYGLSCLFSISYFFQISKYGKTLVIPSIIMVSIIAAFSIFEIVKQTKIAEKSMNLAIKNQAISLSCITGIQKLKLAGAEETAFNIWKESFTQELEVKYNPPLIVKLHKPILALLYGISTIVMYSLCYSNKMDAAEYYAFQTAFGLVLSSFTSLNDLAKSVANLKPGLDLLRPLLAIEPENVQGAEEIESIDGNISVNNVSFRYNENSNYLFKDFSFEVKQGEYVAIVGKTGCGKSTLVKLLLGFEKPETGSICYDGKNIENVDKRSLRKKIGTVMQNDKLFVGSLYENFAVCAPGLTEEQAWEIADIVDMKEDIERMPMKMKTLISEGGGGVSGGQRQRLVIGRAIANKPKVIILDEATSALDNIAQNKICRSLDNLNCTRLVIAHRLSTIKNCDRIICLDKGKIVEDGTYDDLIKLNGFFASLVEKQRLD